MEFRAPPLRLSHFGNLTGHHSVTMVDPNSILRFFKPIRLWIFYWSFSYPTWWRPVPVVSWKVIYLGSPVCVIPFYQVLICLQRLSIFGHYLVPSGRFSFYSKCKISLYLCEGWYESLSKGWSQPSNHTRSFDICFLKLPVIRQFSLKWGLNNL